VKDEKVKPRVVQISGHAHINIGRVLAKLRDAQPKCACLSTEVHPRWHSIDCPVYRAWKDGGAPP
jgi:hypothetical protein